jgi:hypothetical protein
MEMIAFIIPQSPEQVNPYFQLNYCFTLIIFGVSDLIADPDREAE